MSRIRIIGGQWRSRLLPVAAVPGLRPTPDAVRERLFNWLGQDLDAMHCLDLFAGTGVLGFEAASRGAASVTLVERDVRAFARLREAVELLPAPQVRLVRGDALEFAARPSRRFDLLFLDPPYGRGLLDKVVPHLPALLTDDARIYCEAEHAVPALGDFRATREGRAGQVHYQLLERA
ncbi:16S rRNA (guanine(966)-N(2))-methyltransferase RsmD [Methyloversatilis thermotolerans]|uniref:16S rRNA (guanine(966)-N(2))-methyltransferase RsmD n=1 Tax=Methyloversatilis thermotolerans TaxID=1346290 RepID=UPI000367B212|nr:16S rRNA (guanine(966)-N(2))-methyltransferase RsmD [Methyloversatilis thermotolerans]